MNIKLPPERKLRTGLTDLQTVDAHLRRVLSPVVNQINKRFSTGGDEAEVIEVYATEEQLPENEIDEVKDYNLLGAVKFRKTLSERLDTAWNSFLFSFSELMFINNSKIHSVVGPSKNLLT